MVTVKKKVAKKIPRPRELRERGWMVAGFDVSMSSIAGAAIAYDKTLDKLKGPEFVIQRWTSEHHYYERLKALAKAHDFIHELQLKLGIELGLDEVFICQEEPWPFGMIRGGASNALKQQAEMSGAFLGGLVRYGFQNVAQINSMRWRKLVADDLGITTHHTKWQSGELAQRFNCTPKNSGKFRTKEWALLDQGYAFMHVFPKEIPDWPDLIPKKEGRIPRPEGSVAKADQPDDRYDALAIMAVLYEELSENGSLKGNSRQAHQHGI